MCYLPRCPRLAAACNVRTERRPAILHVCVGLSAAETLCYRSPTGDNSKTLHGHHMRPPLSCNLFCFSVILRRCYDALRQCDCDHRSEIQPGPCFHHRFPACASEPHPPYSPPNFNASPQKRKPWRMTDQPPLMRLSHFQVHHLAATTWHPPPPSIRSPLFLQARKTSDPDHSTPNKSETDIW